MVAHAAPPQCYATCSQLRQLVILAPPLQTQWNCKGFEWPSTWRLAGLVNYALLASLFYALPASLSYALPALLFSLALFWPPGSSTSPLPSFSEATSRSWLARPGRHQPQLTMNTPRLLHFALILCLTGKVALPGLLCCFSPGHYCLPIHQCCLPAALLLKYFTSPGEAMVQWSSTLVCEPRVLGSNLCHTLTTFHSLISPPSGQRLPKLLPYCPQTGLTTFICIWGCSSD